MKIWISRSLTLLLLLITCTSSTGIANDAIIFHQWGSMHGQWYYNSINKADLKKMPSWNPSSDEIPLLHSEALKIAIQYLSMNHPSIKNPKIRNIGLLQFLLPEYVKYKWYYVLEFWYNYPAKSGPPDNIKVVVMLDGSINKSLAMPKK